MNAQRWKYSLAVVANAPSVYVITNGQWGAPTIAQVADEKDARLMAAAPQMLNALKFVRDKCTGLPAVARALAAQAIESAEVSS